jgi:cytochrome P450
VSISKWTASSPAQLEHDGESYTLPPKTCINLNATDLHYSTEYWGPDASSFDPSRWDASNKESYLARNDGVSGLAGPGLEHATLHRPARGAYIPFSDGMRACVGKKFAQVEVVAVLAVLLKDYEVCLGDEEGAKSQAWRAIEGSVTILTLGMVEDVPLVFRRKDPMT